jgi:hypothetical protein
VAVLYRGTVEIETLVRYGRVPPGTRARGEAVLSEDDSPYMKYNLTYRITVGNDPRPIAVRIYFDWYGTERKPYSWSMSFRRKSTTFTVRGFAEYVTRELACSLEEHSTGRGNQRFRFIGVEWNKEQQAGAATSG